MTAPTKAVTAAMAGRPADSRVADAMITIQKTHGVQTRVAEIRAFFKDDHVQLALIVSDDGRLITTIERSDLPPDIAGDSDALRIGTLTERTVRPDSFLREAAQVMERTGRRRLAVVSESGHLVGLLCLKRSGTGYCSDAGVRSRAGL